MRLVRLLALAASLGAVGCARAESRPAPDAAPVEASVQITFIDVGQGDAVVVRSPEGRTALIDAGSAAPIETLRALGVEQIDLLVATHPHADHIGGMEDVLGAFPVRFYMDNGQSHTTATYARLMRTLQGRPEIGYLAVEPRTISLGTVELDVLPLPPPGSVDHNDRSVALVLRYGSFLALLSGDSEVFELGWLLEHGAVPDVAVLKAPHHGSDNGVTSEFLRAARPEVVVISVGHNTYGHPRPEALAAYAASGATVYRTDMSGDVTVLGFEDGRYEVTTSRE